MPKANRTSLSIPIIVALMLNNFSRWRCVTSILSAARERDRLSINGQKRDGYLNELTCSPKLGQPALEFSGVRAHTGGGADEPFNSDIGALLPIALCGRTSLSSLRQSSSFTRASSGLMNQCVFKHSARSLPLNDSIKLLSVGLPGREKSRMTPR